MENLLWCFLTGMLGRELLKKIKNGDIEAPLIIVFLCLLSMTQIIFLAAILVIDFLRGFQAEAPTSQIEYAAVFYGCFVFSLLACIALKALRFYEENPKGG